MKKLSRRAKKAREEQLVALINERMLPALESALDVIADIRVRCAGFKEVSQIPRELRAEYLQRLSQSLQVLIPSVIDFESLAYQEMNQEVRCVSLLAYILPKKAREEWLGDLRESRCELINAGYSRWSVSLITWGRVALLFWSLIKVKYQDLGFPRDRS